MALLEEVSRMRIGRAAPWLCLWLGFACDTVPDRLPNRDRELDSGQTSEDAMVDALHMETRHISLNSVWGAAPDDVWAVGAEGNIVHFDGKRWQLQEHLTDANLTSVHGDKADDVWAVGEDVVLHWDGTTWSVVLQDIAEILFSVWQRGENDVWMVGLAWDLDQGVIRHWDGERWTWEILTGVSTLWDVWNSPDDTLWIGGSFRSGAGFLAHAQQKEISQASYGGDSLRGIWGAASDDLWVAPYVGPLHHWDGSQWTEHRAGPDDLRLLGISGSSSDDVWAVGLRGLILHWDGQGWSEVESNSEVTLWSVWVAGPDDAWAVGGEVLHWDGAVWQALPIRH